MRVSECGMQSGIFFVMHVYLRYYLTLRITTLMLEALFVLASEMSLQQNQKNFKKYPHA